MGMRTHVYGIKKPTDRWSKMKSIRDACILANVTIPNEVERYFEFDIPDENGMKINLEGFPCCTVVTGDSCAGFEIDISELRDEFIILRFVNSY